MSTPTHEQEQVLISSARVRVVRSAPGSGKTWLVAELIRRELNLGANTAKGIAALSFTHVGGDEICKAVGHELGHPHYVGTIDAFLFRYVVRPFLRQCYPMIAKPRLIPGEWGPHNWVNYDHKNSATMGKVNLFGCVFIDEENGQSVVAYKPHPAQPLRRIDGSELSKVKNAKLLMWKQSGLLTHSDAALWASKILGHETMGATVRAEVMRRFPLIIVDELQDTGYFLGKSICSLLAEPLSRGVLVGDPDQAIFEFNGARPDLFSRFEALAGAVTLPLTTSRRCAPAIAIAANNVKDSGGTFQPNFEKTARAFLVRYGDLSKSLPEMVSEIKRVVGNMSIKIIARANSTIVDLVGKKVKPSPKLGCTPLNHIQRAVVSFRQDHNIEALAAARAAIDSSVFGHEGLDDQKLEEVGIDPNKWKQLAIESLLTANALPETETVYDWQTQVGKALDEQLLRFSLPPSLGFAIGRLKPQKRGKEWNKACSQFIPHGGTPTNRYSGIPVSTVHGVKGETHDITIFVCPDTTDAHCPSRVWWSTENLDREEKRIAFVAMTRTQGDLIVCVSQGCYQRLLRDRSEFVSSFESVTVDEFLTLWGLRQAGS